MVAGAALTLEARRPDVVRMRGLSARSLRGVTKPCRLSSSVAVLGAGHGQCLRLSRASSCALPNGISRKTGYKWANRSVARGSTG